jgi:hypothetical protein
VIISLKDFNFFLISLLTQPSSSLIKQYLFPFLLIMIARTAGHRWSDANGESPLSIPDGNEGLKTSILTASLRIFGCRSVDLLFWFSGSLLMEYL